MKLPLTLKFFTLAAALLPSLAFAGLSTLTVKISNATPSEGHLEVTLFNSEQTYLTEVYLQNSGIPDENGEYAATFTGLEEGEYAVVVVHDENDNQVYDNGILGFGSEALGYSNNVRPWFSRPGFDEVKFGVEGEQTEISIELH